MGKTIVSTRKIWVRKDSVEEADFMIRDAKIILKFSGYFERLIPVSD